ncbi:ankyrin repeat-containing domain protein [Russula aff. rugulosa BPL654]|nr:ankyrin repeat-containing domain protein [Russula aff. rugulosa BPL654]
MLTLPGQHPIYLIMDALDESSATSGMPSAREKVLRLVKELVDLRHQSLRICVTSRPEVDIKDILEPLTSRRVSLHDQTGQKEDIADYVRSVVYSNLEPIMGRWKKEDKDLVIETLSERADGMFRWVYCQLEVLRHCLPSSVRLFLEELPESLDKTYERVLREIKKPNRDHARRILQCLVVALRPLRVEELAEVVAVDFDDVGGIPKLKPGWRWEDEEQALFTSCSSLIAIVNTGDSRVVQFSHFSVKEYLTSARLATSSQDVSRYHITLKPAHTILARACVSVLLQLGDDDEPDNVEKNAPLAGYGAEYWVRHAQFEDVVSCIKGVEYLFDLDKPYFAAWRRLYDIDIQPDYESAFYQLNATSKPLENHSLYYAALCGFGNLVDQLIIKYPEHVNAIGGYYVTPAVAALAGRYFELAQVLHRNGSSVEAPGKYGNTPLHSAACGDLEMVEVLLEYGVAVDAQNNYCCTPLSFAAAGYHDDPRVARLLIERGADPNIPASSGTGSTPLHEASQNGWIEIARVLLEHGANVEVKDNGGRTPLDIALEGQFRRSEEIVKLLLEHGARREDIVP